MGLYLPRKSQISRKRHRKWLRQLVKGNPGINPEYLQYETAPYAIAWIAQGPRTHEFAEMMEMAVNGRI